MLPGKKGARRLRTRALLLCLSLLGSLALLVSLAYTAENSLSVQGNVDLEITKTADPQPVIAGTQLTYTLTVINNTSGPGIASEVIVSDTLPQETLFKWAPDDCIDGAEPRCLLGSIESGGQRTFNITVIVDPAARGTITNTATVSAREKDNKLQDNRAEIASTVIGRADLRLDKSASTDTVFVGSLLTYTLAVNNSGPSTANDVILTDQLPPEVALKETVPPICTGQVSLSCSLGSIDPGQAVTVSVLVTSTTPGRIINRASVAGIETDPNLVNNTDAEITDVFPPTADLSLGKSVEPNNVLPDQLITYTVSVLNNGPSTASQVILTDTLPSDVEFGGIIEPTAGCTAGTPIICDWTELASSEVRQLIMTATVKPDLISGTVFINQAMVTAQEFDPATENNQAAASGTVRSPEQTDLELGMSVNPQLVLPQDVLTYSMTITNHGPAAATGVKMTNVLPGQLNWGGFLPSTGSCSFASSALECGWSQLAAKGAVTLGFTATVKPDIPAGTLILNDANVSGWEQDYWLGNNSVSVSSSVTSKVECAPDCQVQLPLIMNYWPSWERVGDHPAGASQFFAIAACGDRLLAGSNKGLYSMSSNGSVWQIESGVPDAEVRGIAFAGTDCSRAFAATVGSGVYAGSWGSSWSWTRIDPGLNNARAVTTRQSGTLGAVTLYVGGDFGVYWTPIQPGYDWRPTPISQLTVGLTRHPESQAIFAATWGYGIYRNDSDGGAWSSLGTPASSNTYEVAGNGSGSPLAVGTTSGLFCMAGGGWQKQAREFLDKNTHALVLFQGTLYAGRKGVGVLVSTDDCLSWRLMNEGLGEINSDYEVRDLQASEGGWLYAATTSGIWRRRLP